MSASPLDPEAKLDLDRVLADLASYRPRRRGWSWRVRVADQRLGPFVYRDTSAPLTRSIPLPAAHHFGDVDPQCEMVLTTEIASGRFEDDLDQSGLRALQEQLGAGQGFPTLKHAPERRPGPIQTVIGLG